MRYVVEAIRKREAQEKIPAIRLEIDYELVTLHDAMLENDQDQIKKAKQHLEHLREQLEELTG